MGKYVLAAFALFVTLASCTQESKIEQTTLIKREDFKKTQSLVGSTVQFDDIVLKPTRLQVCDSLLITMNKREERMFHVFNLNSKKKIGECISVGQGPNEMVSPSFVKCDGRSMHIFDMMTCTLFEYPMAEFITSSNPIAVKKTKLSEKIFGDVRFVENGIIGSTYYPNYRFVKFDIAGAKTDTMGAYPSSDASLSEREKLETYKFVFTTNSVDKIAVCSNWTDLIEIYDNEGNLQKRLHGPEQFVSSFKESRNGNVVMARRVKGQTRDAYFNPVSVGDDFFVLFNGKSEDEEGYSQLSNQIFVFGWDGTPKQVLSLDQGVFTFTVDERNKKIYGISDQPEFHIVEFSYD